MAKRSHQHSNSHSTQTSDQQMQGALPPRMSSLPRSFAAPQQAPPPIPLSQMTMEELMQILPRLDAAVIALDWMPCMQKRQQELKTWLQKGSQTPGSESSPCYLDKDLRRVIDESKDVAKTYHELFDVAKSLQNEDLQKKANELDEAHALRSEATIALARHVSMHNDKCEQYERHVEEIRDKAAQSVDILSHFIHKNLDEAMQNAPQDQIEEVLQALFEMKSDMNYSSSHVGSDLYQDLQRALAKSNNERDGLRDMCSQQMATIREQSRDLDRYIARMAKVISLVQEKERQNQSLREELAAANQQYRAKEEAAGTETQNHSEQKSSSVGEVESDALQRSLVSEVWKRDAEITNLRRKLEKAYTRETELQTQIRRLVQSPQGDHSDKQPSRLKRLLTGHQKSSPSIPTLNSMQNLSHSVFTPFQKEKPQVQRSPSPNKSGKPSPMLGAFCEPGSNLDHLELPAAHHSEDTSPNMPPRMREAVRYPQDEIDSAVTHRFYQMPANVRSAASTPRPNTPKSSSTSSNDEISDYRRGRPRFNSDPGVQDFGSNDRFVQDRKPLLDHNRVLSGITEVTEDGGSYKRKSSSPDSTDKKMYLDSMHAVKALGGLQIG
ncbi:hypothetical protein LTR70_000907 [Exophiala xenobiotica]|uniref:Uncharacterized protein n=1 Tax=Lithohypha guttulata TaxID=1690604 RepID=A0ABR0KM67_9EURO|nr:hypothetical protein LTR24_001600 [Lithohypha guttulata]KAK5329071.1 hypothetical protein LTR70_000907 [Exophiala xenobiotica]